jgi:hypothetical protein
LPLSLYPIPLSLFPSGASNPLIPLPPFFDPSEIGVPPGVLGCSFPRGVLSGGVTAVRPLLCFHPSFRFLAAVPYIRCPATTSAGVGPASFPPSPSSGKASQVSPVFFSSCVLVPHLCSSFIHPSFSPPVLKFPNHSELQNPPTQIHHHFFPPHKCFDRNMSVFWRSCLPLAPQSPVDPRLSPLFAFNPSTLQVCPHLSTALLGFPRTSGWPLFGSFGPC